MPKGVDNTVGYIILGVILFIIVAIYVLLHISVRVYCSYKNGEYDVIVKYLGIKLYQLNSNDNKEEPKKQEDEIEISEVGDSHTDVDSIEFQESEDEDEPSEVTSEKKPSLKEKWEEYKQYIPVGKKAVKKLLKIIRIYKLNINIEVGGTDAYKTALNFGRINSVFYPILGLLCTIFSVKIERTSLSCDFESEKTSADISACIYLRPSAVICLALYLLINYWKISRKQKRLNNKENAK